VTVDETAAARPAVPAWATGGLDPLAGADLAGAPAPAPAPVAAVP
jgi:hypothetical protein